MNNDKITNYDVLNNCNSFYFIGIGGAGNSSLATYLKQTGYKVAGSDACYNLTCEKLANLGIKINHGHNFDTLKEYDVVVYSSAIKEDCPEIQLARSLNKTLFKRAELLGFILSRFDKIIAVSGSHGKTTTTALICEIFSHKFNVTAFIGGEYELSQKKATACNIAVVEACEYDRNFLHLHPTDVLILNIDREHVDTYKTIDEQISAFSEFANGTFSIKNGDCKNSKSIKSSLTVGLDNSNDLTAKNIKVKRKISATVTLFGTKLFKFKLNNNSVHFLTNSLFATAIALKYAIPIKNIKKSMLSFKGVKRRNEYLGQFSRYRCYADYAHHPREIDCFVDGFYKTLKGKTLVVFEPHTYSRTKDLIEDFVTSLSKIKDLVIYKTYPAREKYLREGSATFLYEKLANENVNNVYYADNLNCVFEYAKNYKNIVILGAGSLYDEIKSTKILK